MLMLEAANDWLLSPRAELAGSERNSEEAIAQVSLAGGDERVACVIPTLPADPQQLPIVLAQQGTQAETLETGEIDADEAGAARHADELTVGAAITEQAALAVAAKETAAAVPVACESHSGSHHEHAANEYSDGPTAYLHLRSPFGSSYAPGEYSTEDHLPMSKMTFSKGILMLATIFAASRTDSMRSP